MHASYLPKRTVSAIVPILLATFGVSVSLISAAFAADSALPSAPLTKEQRIADFNYLYGAVQDNYPFTWMKERLTGKSWLSRRDEFQQLVGSAPDDAAFFRTMSKAVAALQNGHTQVLTEDMLSTYKDRLDSYGSFAGIARAYSRYSSLTAPDSWSVSASYISGDYWVTRSANPEVTLGSVVTAVNGTPVHAYVLSQQDRALLLSDTSRRRAYARTLPLPEGSDMTLSLLSGSVAKVVTLPTTVSMASVLASASAVATAASPNVVTQILEPGKIAYVKIQSFASQNIKQDGPALLKFLESIKAYPHLIIDIRGNGGGEDAYWQDLLVAPLTPTKLTVPQRFVVRRGADVQAHTRALMGSSFFLAREPKSSLAGMSLPAEVTSRNFGDIMQVDSSVAARPIGFTGRISLLVDDGVYASSEAFASFAKGSGWATLVGTPTGGNSAVIAPMLLTLPNSRIVVRMSSAMGLAANGSAIEEMKTMPDVSAEELPVYIRVRLTSAKASTIDPAWDSVLRTAMSSRAGSQRGASPIPKLASLGFTAYAGYSVEPALQLTLNPRYGGTHKVGAVVDLKLKSPGFTYTGQRYLAEGVSIKEALAYTPWPSAVTGAAPTLALEQRVGLKWTSDNQNATVSAFIRQIPAGGLPERQSVGAAGRTEAVLSGLQSVGLNKGLLQLWGTVAREFAGSATTAMGGMTLEAQIKPIVKIASSLYGSVSGGWSSREHEFSMDDTSSPFALVGPAPGWSGTEALKASATLRLRPNAILAFTGPGLDAWIGPQIDWGWVGERSSLTERTGLSASIVAGLDVGPSSDAMGIRLGVAVPITGGDGLRPYLLVSTPIF